MGERGRQKNIEKKIFKTNHINNHTACKWSKYLQLKRQRLSDKKNKKDLNTFTLWETYSKCKDTNRLKEWKRHKLIQIKRKIKELYQYKIKYVSQKKYFMIILNSLRGHNNLVFMHLITRPENKWSKNW